MDSAHWMMETFAGLLEPELVHSHKQAGNTPPGCRAAEATREAYGGCWDIRCPVGGTKPGVYGVHDRRAMERRAEAGRWVNRGSQGIRSPSLSSMAGGQGCMVLAWGGLQHGGHWARAGAASSPRHHTLLGAQLEQGIAEVPTCASLVIMEL